MQHGSFALSFRKHETCGRRLKGAASLSPGNSTQTCPSLFDFQTLTIPELEQSKAAVLNTLASAHSRRGYEYAIEKFIAWYCAEPRLAFNRSVVARYRSFLESQSLSAATINLHLSAIRRLADESAESGWLSPELAIGIRRVKGAKKLGRRIGNWLTGNQSQELLNAVSQDTLRGRRDGAMLGLLIGCGLRRSEVVGLRLDQLQLRESRWVIVGLAGKGGRVRYRKLSTLSTCSDGIVFLQCSLHHKTSLARRESPLPAEKH
jgi:site-specific recombinase XerD